MFTKFLLRNDQCFFSSYTCWPEVPSKGNNRRHSEFCPHVAISITNETGEYLNFAFTAGLQNNNLGPIDSDIFRKATIFAMCWSV